MSKKKVFETGDSQMEALREAFQTLVKAMGDVPMGSCAFLAPVGLDAAVIVATGPAVEDWRMIYDEWVKHSNSEESEFDVTEETGQ
jgi:hypothetical protein